VSRIFQDERCLRLKPTVKRSWNRDRKTNLINVERNLGIYCMLEDVVGEEGTMMGDYIRLERRNSTTLHEALRLKGTTNAS
jgi:hypothetical protein